MTPEHWYPILRNIMSQIYKQLPSKTIYGPYLPPTIDINKEHSTPVYLGPGQYGTVRSMTINPPGAPYTLIPSIYEGSAHSPRESVDRYRQTGKHLGQFPTEEDAARYGQSLSESQGHRVRPTW